MARKSRKQNVIIEEQMGVSVIDKTDKKNVGMEADSTMQGKKCYRTVIYTRISDEDERKIASRSIENQQEMLIEYVNQQEDMQLVDKYMDRAISGTKFDRPDFNRMIADMRQGKFECIVVKDLSRLGRNYLESGEYIEKIFPFFRIRFVAVTDNYDSLHSSVAEDGLIVPLKNMINEAYAKDISKKICSSKEQAQKQGLFVGSFAPYGYLKSPEDHFKLVVDPVTAPTIKRIFDMTERGIGRFEIVRELNAEGVLSPMQYRMQIGLVNNKRYEKIYWETKVITSILKNPVYIGDMEQHTEVSALYKNQPPKRTKKEDRIYVKNTHEPIVEREQFFKIQTMLEENSRKCAEKSKKYANLQRKENIFRGVLYCGDCDVQLSFYRRTVELKSGYHHYYTYLCNRTKSYGEERCRKKIIKLAELEHLVTKVIHQHIRCFLDSENMIAELNSTNAVRGIWSKYQDDISGVEKHLEQMTLKNTELYDDYADGILSEKDYLMIKKRYMTEIEQLKEKMKQLREEQKRYEATYKVNRDISDTFRKYEDFTELTKDIIHTFIKKIIYYGNQRFEIIYTFQSEFDEVVEQLEKRRKEVYER